MNRPDADDEADDPVPHEAIDVVAQPRFLGPKSQASGEKEFAALQVWRGIPEFSHVDSTDLLTVRNLGNGNDKTRKLSEHVGQGRHGTLLQMDESSIAHRDVDDEYMS